MWDHHVHIKFSFLFAWIKMNARHKHKFNAKHTYIQYIHIYLRFIFTAAIHFFYIISSSFFVLHICISKDVFQNKNITFHKKCAALVFSINSFAAKLAIKFEPKKKRKKLFWYTCWFERILTTRHLIYLFHIDTIYTFINNIWLVCSFLV